MEETAKSVTERVDGMIARDSQDTELAVTLDNIKINNIETSTNEIKYKFSNIVYIFGII